MKVELDLGRGRELTVTHDTAAPYTRVGAIAVIVKDNDKGWRIPMAAHEAEQLLSALKYLLGH